MAGTGFGCRDPMVVTKQVCGKGVVSVSPDVSSVEMNQRISLEATFTSHDAGCRLSNPQFRWTSSDTAVAFVSGSGSRGAVHVAYRAAEAIITATLQGGSQDSTGQPFRGTATVRVLYGPPKFISIHPLRGLVTVGESVTFTAEVRNEHSIMIPDPVTWSSLDPSIASILPTGLATGHLPGQATIVATVGSLAESAVLEVRAAPGPTVPVARVDVTPASGTVQAGEILQLTATARDAAGTELKGRQIAWQSSDADLAHVYWTGEVQGMSPGQVEIKATIEGKSGSGRVTVIPSLRARYAYALVDDPTSQYGAANQYSWANQPIIITDTGIGEYDVKFLALRPPSGQTQVLQVNGFGPRVGACKIAGVRTSGIDLVASVRCFGVGDSPLDQPFAILLLGSESMTGRFAFGWADQPTVGGPYAASAMHSSSGQTVRVRRDLNGVYTVMFPGLSRPAGGAPEIALVTAAGPLASRCTVNGFLNGIELPVHCVGPASTAFIDDDAAFMVALLERGPPGKRFAFATIPAQGKTIDSNHAVSTGGAITMSRLVTGRVEVNFGSLGRVSATQHEIVLVSPRTEYGAFCNVLDYRTAANDLIATVQCYDFNGVASDEEFRILVIE